MHVERTGKTARDRVNGCHKRNEANKAERDAWREEGPRGTMRFPIHTCNGKATRALRNA